MIGLNKEADKIFSLYIRTLYSEEGWVRCSTCGRHDKVKNMDCGHYMSRRNMATRYDVRNAAPQCKVCNQFEGGRQKEMAEWIDNRFGKGTAKEMEALSKTTIHNIDYLDIIDRFKNELKQL